MVQRWAQMQLIYHQCLSLSHQSCKLQGIHSVARDQQLQQNSKTTKPQEETKLPQLISKTPFVFVRSGSPGTSSSVLRRPNGVRTKVYLLFLFLGSEVKIYFPLSLSNLGHSCFPHTRPALFGVVIHHHCLPFLLASKHYIVSHR